MARVTPTEVKEILEFDPGTIDAFITAANLFVTEMLSGKGLSDDLLKEIERWVSAHLVAIMDGDLRLDAEKIGDASSKYQGKTGMHLNATLYGQQAQMLDSTGTLVDVGKTQSSVESLDYHTAETDWEDE